MKKQNLIFNLSLLIIFTILSATSLRAQQVSEDSSFNFTGIAGADIDSTNDDSYTSALQSDGKIVSGGFVWIGAFYYTLTRLNPDGSPDSSFGNNGQVLGSLGQQQHISAIAIQPDGKIVAGIINGSTTFNIVRYLTNGVIDSTFDNDGYALIAPSGNFGCSLYDLTVQPDGKIIAVGQGYTTGGVNFAMAVMRLNSDGTLDTTFNSTGILIYYLFGSQGTYAHAVTLQPDGKILVGGYYEVNGTNDNFIIIRLNTNGTFDTTFNSSGINTANLIDVDHIKHIAVQPNGKIIATGESIDNALGHYAAVVRFRTDGLRDSTFSGDGKILLAARSGVASFPLPNGDLIIGADGAQNGLFELIKLKPDGTPDSLFGINGYYHTTPALGNSGFVNDGFMQPDGKIVLTGKCIINTPLSYDMAAIRYIISVDNYCVAHYSLHPDTVIPHNWIAVNESAGSSGATYTWDWGDGSPVSYGFAPSHTYSSPGNYNICLTINDTNGCSHTYCDSSTYLFRYTSNAVPVTINAVLPIGVNEISTEDFISVYPNPAKDHLTIHSGNSKMNAVEIYSSLGEIVYAETVKSNAFSININKLENGIYLLRCITDKGIITKKMVVASSG